MNETNRAQARRIAELEAALLGADKVMREWFDYTETEHGWTIRTPVAPKEWVPMLEAQQISDAIKGGTSALRQIVERAVRAGIEAEHERWMTNEHRDQFATVAEIADSILGKRP